MYYIYDSCEFKPLISIDFYTISILEGNMHFQYISYEERVAPIKTASREGFGELIKAHYHKSMELILVECGTLRAFVNGKCFECCAGDILLIPCDSVHRGSADESTHILSVFFDPALLHHATPEIRPEELLHRELAFSYILKSQDAASAFLALYKKCNNGAFSAGDVLQIVSGLYEIIGEYLNRLPNDDVTENYNRLSPVIEYIKENLHRPIRISELSAILYVCDDHLIRLFKQSTHKTPSRYIMDLRIEAAMQLLGSTDLSVSEIADRVGFSQGSFMTKVFKEKLNILPKDYRKLIHMQKEQER